MGGATTDHHGFVKDAVAIEKDRVAKRAVLGRAHANMRPEAASASIPLIEALNA